MRNLLNRLFVAVLGLLLLPLTMMAQTVPEYEGTAFDKSQALANDGMLFFGFIIAGAIIVTGFFLGRRWLRRVG
jgi:hypothetical protein